MNSIDETLKKMAAGISPRHSDSAGGGEPPVNPRAYMPGNPDCPICQGIGFLRHDLPVGHPDFGKLSICTCRQGQVSRGLLDRLQDFAAPRQVGVDREGNRGEVAGETDPRTDGDVIVGTTVGKPAYRALQQNINRTAHMFVISGQWLVAS